MEYYSESNRPPIEPEKETNPIVPIYEEVLNTKTNKIELKKVAETNLYQKIQESRDATDIQKIIERYEIKLDDKININDEILDYTENPTSLIEAHSMILKAEQIWKQEPIEVKKEFGNNFEEYLAAANNGTLKKTYQKLAPKKFNVEEPTKENFLEEKEIIKEEPKGVKVYE